MANTLKDELIHTGAVAAASILMAALVKCPQPLLAGGILAGVTYGSDRFFRVPGASQMSGNAGLAVNAAAGLFTELTKQPILLAAGLVTPLFFGGNILQGLALGLAAPIASVASTVYVTKMEVQAMTSGQPTAAPSNAGQAIPVMSW